MAAVYTINNKKIGNLPEKCIKLLIARKRLKNMDGINWELSLAPSKKLFWDYKKDIISWEQYEERYIEELKSNYDILNKIKAFVDKGINIALICYCDDIKYCHRRLVGECLEKMGLTVIYE